MKNLATICAIAAFLAVGIVAALPNTAGAASPAATVSYVQNVASNTLAAAKAYTEAHVPEIDLTPYAKKNDLPLRVDCATNVVWREFVSNGFFFVVAYTNTPSAGATP